jgi:iron complex outermembrane receptor protein
MVYVSYNRGFKSGVYDLLGFAQPGFDPDFPDGRSTTAQPVDPEILDAYEIGAKIDLFDRRLRVNVAAFYNDFQNIQLLQIVTGGTQTLNAGSAAIQGFELEFSAWLPKFGFFKIFCRVWMGISASGVSMAIPQP